MLRYIFSLAVLQFSLAVQAQTNERIYHPAPEKVKVFGPDGEMGMAWCGGASAPQFAMADLNQDGLNDLVIYEYGGNMSTFINMGAPGLPQYQFSPQYANSFPPLLGFLKIVDFNSDGVPDVWTGSDLKLSVGYYNNNHQLMFYPPKRVVYYPKNASIPSSITIRPDFMPSIVDVDNDGDIDVLVYYAQGNTVAFYRNFQKEIGSPNDSLVFRFVDYCWGKTLKWDDVVPHQLDWSCNNSGLKMEPTGQNKTTGGSHCITLLDYDGDGDYDFFDAMDKNTDIQLLINGKVEYGVNKDSMMSEDIHWPSSGHQVFMPNYPAAYWVDIDADGDKDLVFSPLKTNGENYRCIAYYKNVQSDASPKFDFVADTLFMNSIIDLGSRAFPTLYDYNKDGKQDLIIGSAGYYQPGNGSMRSRLSLFLNNSGPNNVSLQLQTTDLVNLSNLVFVGAAPAIGDLDGDGKDDLVIGQTDGTMRFFQNDASSNNEQPVWRLRAEKIKANGNEINVGGSAAPLVYDFNQDGKNDLLVGNYNGEIEYYQNTGNGTKGIPSLTLVTKSLGQINVSAQYNVFGYSTPHIGKLDNTGNDYILVGNDQGIIARYAIQRSNPTAAFQKLDSIYSEINTSTYAAPVVGDIDNDGKYEMIVGTGMGGVMLYEQLFNTGMPDLKTSKNGLSLYPNPAGDELTVYIDGTANDEHINIRILNGMGQTVSNAQITKIGERHFRINTSALATGVYMCTVVSDKRAYSATFIKK